MAIKFTMPYAGKYMRRPEPDAPLQEPPSQWPLGVAIDPAYLAQQDARNRHMRSMLSDPENIERWRQAEIERLQRQSVFLDKLVPPLPKPRMRVKYHIWSCVSGTRFVDMVIGYGYSPREAYDDWHKRTKARSR